MEKIDRLDKRYLVSFLKMQECRSKTVAARM